MGRTRTLLHDARSAGANHPFMVIGLGMVLIALLTVAALLVVARRRGLSASELADFQRWRERVIGAAGGHVVDAEDEADEADDGNGVEGTIAEA